MCADLAEAGATTGPSILDLIRLSPSEVLPPGGRELYRELALLAGLGKGEPTEVLDVACGDGAGLQFLVEEFGVHGSGVDPDATTLTRAQARAKARGLSERLQFQEAPPDALPYRDEIFDLTIGELGLAAGADPERAVAELARVTRPGGTLVLLQLVWKSPVDEARRASIGNVLGVVPQMLVEWKRLLRDHGVTDLHVADWSDDRAPFRPRLRKPFPDFAELFTLSQKVAILRRVRRHWGWAGVRAALRRESEVHRLLTKARALGFVLIKGSREVTAAAGAGLPVTESGVVDGAEPRADSGSEWAAADLPLFGGEVGPESEEPPSRPGRGGAGPAEATRNPRPTPVPAREAAPARTPVRTQVEDLPLFSDERERAR